jgi:hypothetical protein
MLVVLLLTMCGWILAPAFGLEIGVIAMLGLLGAVVTGNFGRQTVQALDWDYIVFYGVALSLAHLSASLGFDRVIGGVIGPLVGANGAGVVAVVLVIATMALLVCLAVGPDQTVLLLGLALVPTVAQLGIEPWIAIVIVLAMAGVWLIPSQVPMYLGAYSASEGRLFSPDQARRAAFGYVAVLVVALVLSVPFWHALRLL